MNLFKRFDTSYIFLMIVISLCGILCLHSATYLKESNIVLMQFFWLMLSIGIALIVSIIPIQILYKLSYATYFVTIIMVVVVLFLGKIGMGAQRWLVLGPLRVQPSELMKIGLIFGLSRFFYDYEPHKSMNLKTFFFSLVITAVPAVLVILQPDLGTAGLLFFIYFFYVIYKRLSLQTMVILSFLTTVSLFFFYAFGLKEYQKKRIIHFLAPMEDVRGAGYNAYQSKIAIGSGKIIGKGFKKSTQASLEFLPENHTDFIFALFNEEQGFIGSCILLGLFLFLIVKALMLSIRVSKYYHSLLAIGIAAFLFWHVVINVSMCTGIFPVVGIPLPFFSYGGSNLLTFGIAFGLITNISKDKTLF